MSRQAFSMIAIACALSPPCDSRVMAWSVALLRPTSRGTMPITTSANLRSSAVRPPAPYPSLYSAQPMRPPSVTTFRNENTRQPASACKCSKRTIFIVVSLKRYDMLQRLAAHEAREIGADEIGEALAAGCSALAGAMLRDDEIGCVPQRIIRGQRLGIGNVEAGACDRAGAQGRLQRTGLDNAAARDDDQDSVL